MVSGSEILPAYSHATGVFSDAFAPQLAKFRGAAPDLKRNWGVATAGTHPADRGNAGVNDP
jgi:hypothetical protein